MNLSKLTVCNKSIHFKNMTCIRPGALEMNKIRAFKRIFLVKKDHINKTYI